MDASPQNRFSLEEYLKMLTTKIITTLATSLSLAILLSACSSSDGNNEDKQNYDAALHRTEGGIPHIIANDWGSIGYGTGYAAAQDHFCEQSRNILKFRAELAANLGAGEDNENLDSDFFFKLLQDQGLYNEEIDSEFEEIFAGYAAGFNRYLEDTGAENISDPSCSGAQWIPTVTAEDVKRIHLTPAFLPNFASLILPAKPPEEVAALKGIIKNALSPSKKIQGMSPVEKQELGLFASNFYNQEDHGSNGVAIGQELSSDQSGLLFTNPHLGWDSFDFRMYAMHQIIPGVSNMMGANQAQRAHVGFGTNGHIAWTNTVSTSQAFMFYKLDLVPGNTMAYIFDGEERNIEAIEVSVDVLDGEGNLTPATHTFYQSHHGLMIGGQFPWLTSLAFSLRIANEGARGFQGGAMAMANSTTVRELKEAINTYQSTPGINTIAADSTGEVLYGDLGPVVNFTDQQLIDCNFSGPVYLGNTSACEWNTDEDSAAPGLLGASKQAALFRSDYVTNSNNSYWLANPNEPLTGIPKIQGDIETERSARTRSGLRIIQDRIDGTDSLPGNTFDLDTLAQQVMGNHSYAGRILRDDLVTLCENNPTAKYDGDGEPATDDPVTVDISAACPVLASWDLTSNIDSIGSHIFREMMREGKALEGSRPPRTLPVAFNYTTPFDVNDPVNTPRGFDTSNNPAVLSALAIAVQRFTDADIALDATLGDIQGVTRNGKYLPMPGGEEFEGVLNKMGLEFAGSEGYPEVTGSSASWIMMTQLSPEKVTVKGFMAYSQSSDPTSPFYSDMTEAFSAGELIDIPYTQEEVEAAAISTIVLTTN
jgi:acyl-homoserine-lactone acylase